MRLVAWPVIIILSAAMAGLLTYVDVGSPLRLVVVMWFMLVCPGMVLVRFLALRDPLFEWTLAVALSLAADAFVAGALLYAGKWSTSSAFALLLGLTVAGALILEINTIRTQRRVVR